MADAKKANDGPLEFPSKVDVNNDIPSEETMSKVADFLVLNVDGKEGPFRSLYDGANGEKKSHKFLVVSVGISSAE
jgi:hypothetical protein